MGITALSAPSVVDYVNGASQAPTSEKISEFFSATEFAIRPEVRVAKNWSVGAVKTNLSSFSLGLKLGLLVRL
jgi:hypothetical protein